MMVAVSGRATPRSMQLSGQDSWRAQQGIAVDGSVQIVSGERLDLAAPRIEFAPGFRVEVGGQLRATAMAVHCGTD